MCAHIKMHVFLIMLSQNYRAICFDASQTETKILLKAAKPANDTLLGCLRDSYLIIQFSLEREGERLIC